MEHPYQKNVISDEEKVLLEVEYLLWFLSSPDGAPYETTDSEDLRDTDGVFSLEKLMEFPALRKLCDTEERLR